VRICDQKNTRKPGSESQCRFYCDFRPDTVWITYGHQDGGRGLHSGKASSVSIRLLSQTTLRSRIKG